MRQAPPKKMGPAGTPGVANAKGNRAMAKAHRIKAAKRSRCVFMGWVVSASAKEFNEQPEFFSTLTALRARPTLNSIFDNCLGASVFAVGVLRFGFPFFN